MIIANALLSTGLYFQYLAPAVSELEKLFGEALKHLQQPNWFQFFAEVKVWVTMTWKNENLHTAIVVIIDIASSN